MSSIVQLGRLERAELRDAWPHEAANFTPWLAEAENLSMLGDALGLSLELEAIEHPVESFSADIVARDLVGGGRVLIENQLEQTDHSHLGQILTYAAGIEATTVVWIAREFREPHRAAIDYLNSISLPNHNFFAIQLELYRIGTSLLAPRLSVIAKPNDWSKAVAARTIDSSEREIARNYWAEYWAKFFAHASKGDNSFAKRTPPREGWCRLYQIRSGDPSVPIYAHRNNAKVRAVCWIQGNETKALFDILKTQQSEIERSYGGRLHWDRMDGKKSTMIFDQIPAQNDAEPTEFDWMLSAATRLRNSLRPFVDAPIGE